MNSFTDKYDQQWILELDLTTVRHCEDYEFPRHGKITFFPPTENLLSLLTETGVTFGMIWVICKDQIHGKFYQVRTTEENKTTKLEIKNEEDFARCFDGPTLERAREALFLELGNFFPQMQTTLTRLTARFSSLKRIADDKIGDKLDEELSDAKITEMVDELLNETPPLPTKMQKTLDQMENQKV